MRLRKPGNFDVKHCTGAPRPNGAPAHIRIRRSFVTPPGNCNTSFLARCATVSAPGSPRPNGAPAHIRIRRSFVTPQWSRGWFPPRQLQHKFRGAFSLRPTIPYLTFTLPCFCRHAGTGRCASLRAPCALAPPTRTSPSMARARTTLIYGCGILLSHRSHPRMAAGRAAPKKPPA